MSMHQPLLIGGNSLEVPFWIDAVGATAGGWDCCAYGNGTFVTLDSNTVMISTNYGNTFVGDTGTTHAWRDMCFGNNTFAAVAFDGVGQYSTDNGLNWTAVDISAGNVLNGIGYSASLGMFLVTRNSSDKFYTSPSMLAGTWTERTFPAVADWSGVCWSQSFTKWLVGGRVTVGSQCAYSSDGVTFTLATTPALLYNQNMRISEGNGVAFSPARTLSGMRTTDGITWLDTGAIVGSAFAKETAYVSPYFLARSDTDKMYYSDDGAVSFTEQTMTAVGGVGRMICGGLTAGNNKYFATRTGVPYVYVGDANF